MSYDDMKNLWRSDKNSPTPDDVEKQKAEFTKKLRKGYRGFLIQMAIIFAGLTFITGKMIHHLATQNLAGDRTHSVDLATEWAVIPLLALPWLAAILFVRQHLKHRRAHPDYDHSILASLRATADATQLAVKRMKIIIALHLGGLPILALSIQQINDAGKIRPHELRSMIALFAIVTVGAIGCLAFEYFRNLLPKKRHIDQLMASYDIAKS